MMWSGFPTRSAFSNAYTKIFDLGNVLCISAEIKVKRLSSRFSSRKTEEKCLAIVLDKPLSEAQELVDDPDAFVLEITEIIQNKHAHPVIAQMLHPDVRDDFLSSECATASW